MGDASATQPNIRREISLRLHVVARQMRGRFDRSIAAIGITRSQWTVIAVVARAPGLTQRQLAETLEMTEAAAGRQIDRLCADRMLERRPREDDRRAYSVYVGDAARPILDLLGTAAAASEAIAFSGFSNAELEALAAFLARIRDNIDPARETG